MKEPADWAMKAATEWEPTYHECNLGAAVARRRRLAAIIESAWEEHQASGMWDFQNEYMNAVTAEQLAKFTVDRKWAEYVTKVGKLVEAAKYAITTNDWTPGPGTRRGDLREAIADLERKS